MNRSSLFLAATLMIAGPAYASGNNNNNDNGTHNQEQDQDQYQRQSQNATSRSTSRSTSKVGDVVANVEVSNPKPAVSSAPDIYVATCNRGISGQMYDAGGSLGSKDPVCTYLDLSAAARSAGDTELANELFDRAVSEANTRHFFTRVFSWIPVVGFLF